MNKYLDRCTKAFQNTDRKINPTTPASEILLWPTDQELFDPNYNSAIRSFSDGIASDGAYGKSVKSCGWVDPL